MLIDIAGRPIGTKREIGTTNKLEADFAAAADSVFRKLDLTVVCIHCGGTPQGRNDPGDANWTLECACTRRVLRNPNVRSH